MKIDLDALAHMLADLRSAADDYADAMDQSGAAVTHRQIAELRKAIADTTFLCLVMAASQRVGYFGRFKTGRLATETTRRIFASLIAVGSAED